VIYEIWQITMKHGGWLQCTACLQGTRLSAGAQNNKKLEAALRALTHKHATPLSLCKHAWRVKLREVAAVALTTHNSIVKESLFSADNNSSSSSCSSRRQKHFCAGALHAAALHTSIAP
jgi:hypothetical protein